MNYILPLGFYAAPHKVILTVFLSNTSIIIVMVEVGHFYKNNAIWTWWDTSGRGVFDTTTHNPVMSCYSLSLDKRRFPESQAVV